MFYFFNKRIEEEYIYTTEEKGIIRNLKQTYGNLYDYSKLRYSKHLKLTLICKYHGEFKQMYYTLTLGRGCNKCRSQQNFNNIYKFYYK